MYPAAALKRWGQSFTLYKGRQFRAARVLRVAALIEAGLPVTLQIADREAVEASDDGLDALVASVVAQAIELGLTDDCPAEGAAACRSEGWIRVPTAGSSMRDLMSSAPAPRMADLT